MPKYDVIMDSFVCVEADTEEQAIDKARDAYIRLLQDNEAMMIPELYTEEEYVEGVEI